MTFNEIQVLRSAQKGSRSHVLQMLRQALSEGNRLAAVLNREHPGNEPAVADYIHRLKYAARTVRAGNNPPGVDFATAYVTARLLVYGLKIGKPCWCPGSEQPARTNGGCDRCAAKDVADHDHWRRQGVYSPMGWYTAKGHFPVSYGAA